MNPAIFAKFVSVTFQKQITYRFNYFMGIINGFLYVFIYTSLWRALYAQSETNIHGGFSLTAIITYAVMVMAVRISFSMDDFAIYEKVRDGSVAIDLIRPVSFFFINLAENIGYSLFNLMARTIPILLISTLIFDLYLPVEPVRFAAFFISAVCGYLILFMINFVIGLLAFWFVEIFPFMMFKFGLFTIFSGSLLPMDFFPDFMVPLMKLMPFQYILYTPTVILTGHARIGNIPEMITSQLMWVLVLAGICKIMWNAARNKLVIQGG